MFRSQKMLISGFFVVFFYLLVVVIVETTTSALTNCNGSKRRRTPRHTLRQAESKVCLANEFQCYVKEFVCSIFMWHGIIDCAARKICFVFPLEYLPISQAKYHVRVQCIQYTLRWCWWCELYSFEMTKCFRRITNHLTSVMQTTSLNHFSRQNCKFSIKWEWQICLANEWICFTCFH